MPTSRERFRAVFDGKADRPPFIPLMAAAAARLMQAPLRDAYGDAAVMAKTLRDCQALFGYDAVVVFPDLTLGAEALGCTLEWRDDGPPAVAQGLASFESLDALPAGSMAAGGRMPAALDAAGQLVETIGRGCAVLGAVTGPVTLARLAFSSLSLLEGADGTRAIERLAAENLTVARAFFERRVDGVVVLDPDLAEAPPTVHDALTKAFRTLHNLARFYDGRLLLAARGPAPIAASLDADGLSLGGLDLGTQVAGAKRGQARGALISADAWSDNLEETVRAIADDADGSLYLTTDGEVPHDTPADSLHDVMDALEG